MKPLVLGSSGMLGSAFCDYFSARMQKYEILNRSIVDFSDFTALKQALDKYDISVLINCAAIIDINFCTKNPSLSYKINASMPSFLSRYCVSRGIKFIHISTDHFYSGSDGRAHTETEPVQLMNAYSFQKWTAENEILRSNNHALILRTSLLGYNKRRNSLIDWILSSLVTAPQITGFVDAYTSSIDVHSFCDLLLSGNLTDQEGIFNLANDRVYTKHELIKVIVEKLGLAVKIIPESVQLLNVPRANNCGLCISKAKKHLKYVPTLERSLHNLNLYEHINDIRT